MICRVYAGTTSPRSASGRQFTAERTMNPRRRGVIGSGLAALKPPEVFRPDQGPGAERRAMGLPTHRTVAVGRHEELARDLVSHLPTQTAAGQ